MAAGGHQRSREGEVVKSGTEEWQSFYAEAFEVLEFDVGMSSGAAGHSGKGAVIVLESRLLEGGSGAIWLAQRRFSFSTFRQRFMMPSLAFFCFHPLQLHP